MTRDEARKYVEHWKRVGPLLDEQERNELRNYTLADRQRDIRALLELAAQFSIPRNETGFLEQQRLFKRAME
jgi:hypothetical protein